MKTKESLIVAVIIIFMFSVFYMTVPANNPKTFKMPIPKSEHRKVHDRLEQSTKQQKDNETRRPTSESSSSTKSSVITIEECNCNR